MSEKKSGRDRLYEAVVLEENRGSVPLSYMTDGQLMGLAADRIEWLETQNVKPLATNEPPEPPLPCEEEHDLQRWVWTASGMLESGIGDVEKDQYLAESDALALIASLKETAERNGKYADEERKRADDNRDLLAASELRSERLKSENAQLRGEVEGLKVALRQLATKCKAGFDETTFWYNGAPIATMSLEPELHLALCNATTDNNRANLTGEEPSSGGAG